MGLFGSLFEIALAPVRVARDVVSIPVRAAVDVIEGDVEEAAAEIVRSPVTVAESVVDNLEKAAKEL